jgi:hypothetical protein
MIERMTLSAHATDRGMDSSRVAQPLLAFAPTDPTVRRYRSGLFRKDPRRVDGRLCEVSRAHNAARSASGAATLDGARQGGLRHVAPLGCAREIQLLGHREEITNLVHFHDNLTGWSTGMAALGGLYCRRLYCQRLPFGWPHSGSRSHPHCSPKRSALSARLSERPRPQAALRPSMHHSSRPESIRRANRIWPLGWPNVTIDARSKASNAACGQANEAPATARERASIE